MPVCPVPEHEGAKSNLLGRAESDFSAAISLSSLLYQLRWDSGRRLKSRIASQKGARSARAEREEP